MALSYNEDGETIRVPKKVTWDGEKPTRCDACEGDFKRATQFVDGVIYTSIGGSWGLFHVTCFKRFRGTYGTGRGQRYDLKTLEKIDG